ncbi:hypothetical protein AAVH_35180, partial [Aphelenchoides avenae]
YLYNVVTFSTAYYSDKQYAVWSKQDADKFHEKAWVIGGSVFVVSRYENASRESVVKDCAH